MSKQPRRQDLFQKHTCDIFYKQYSPACYMHLCTWTSTLLQMYSWNARLACPSKTVKDEDDKCVRSSLPPYTIRLCCIQVTVPQVRITPFLRNPLSVKFLEGSGLQLGRGRWNHSNIQQNSFNTERAARDFATAFVLFHFRSCPALENLLHAFFFISLCSHSITTYSTYSEINHVFLISPLRFWPMCQLQSVISYWHTVEMSSHVEFVSRFSNLRVFTCSESCAFRK